MAENSGIEWTHHTFNPWIGCTKVSPACDFCYAEEWNKRYDGGKNWGPHAPRRRTKTWGNPVKWNREAERLGIRYRVFCASLADIGDNHKSIMPEWRSDLKRLIDDTPHLDWLLLTKRPQNLKKYYPDEMLEKCWIGTTVENQEEAERRIPHLVEINARVRFLSMEPLLGLTSIVPWIDKIHWVITGGESGTNYRAADPEWFRSLRNQCVNANVPFLFKQWEGKNQSIIKSKGRELDGIVWDQYPQRSGA